MNIVMLAAHACIRVTKEALALIERGHKVHIITFKLPSFADSFTTVSRCFDIGQMREAIKIYEKSADVIHAHNEPSWFVSMAKELSDKPVILDVHDSFLTRLTLLEEQKRIDNGERLIRIQTEERNNMQMADGLVFPGELFKDKVSEEFDLTQPCSVLPSYLPESLYLYDTKEWMGGLVYEGRVDLQKEVETDPKLFGFRYCVYEEMARECGKFGIPFYIQSVRTDEPFQKAYEDIAHVMDPVGWDKLLKRISCHDWGLVGNIYPTLQWDVAMPNKLFEYIAAGVPPVVMNAKESAKFVKDTGIGIVVESVKELSERWKEHRECRNRLLKIRGKFTMNANIHTLESLYELLCV